MECGVAAARPSKVTGDTLFGRSSAATAAVTGFRLLQNSASVTSTKIKGNRQQQTAEKDRCHQQNEQLDVEGKLLNAQPTRLEANNKQILYNFESSLSSSI